LRILSTFVRQKDKSGIDMETIMSWAKENFDLICLLVGALGVVISVVSVIQEIKKKRRNGRNKVQLNNDNLTQKHKKMMD